MFPLLETTQNHIKTMFEYLWLINSYRRLIAYLHEMTANKLIISTDL